MFNILKLFGGNWIIIGLLIVGLSTYTGFIYYQGYQKAASHWEQKYNNREIQLQHDLAIEQDRQYKANQRAKEIEQLRITELNRKQTELDTLLNENRNEAIKSPNSNRIGLDADGVYRLDRIK